MGTYSIGLDFGSEEARAVLLDMEGAMIASASQRYAHGIMSEQLPCGVPLEPSFALQHPADYIQALDVLIPTLFQKGADPQGVIGIGVDFTQCTMMPVDKQGVPLCLHPQYEANPYAYAKLWKHHAAQPQAERMTEVARNRGERFLQFCGGSIYAESMFPKILETYEKAPEIYQAADAFIELADWITFYLTGSRTRSRSIAACAALWSPQAGYPSGYYFAAVAPGFSQVVQEKLTQDLAGVCHPVGQIKPELARRWGLPPAIPVAAALGDSQPAFVGAGLSGPNVMLSVIGTSSCDILVNEEELPIPGLYGVSYDSILPGLYGYEAGQATLGDLFKWFVDTCVPTSYFTQAQERGLSIFDHLNDLAKRYEPGESGLLVLDWWNGNRSVLLDTNLSGMILGLRLSTKCEEIYRALVEGLSFGKRRIVEQFCSYGARVERLCATGGVAVKNPFLMQTYADVIGIPVSVSTADNGSCIGSAIYGAVAAGEAAGGYNDIRWAAKKMGGGVAAVYTPNPCYRQIYDILYEEYKTLHDYFGISNPVMKRLRGV